MPRAPAAERGFTTIQYVVATGFSLIFLVLAANFVVFQYGRGAVRAAIDEGARAGSVEMATDRDRVAACQERSADVLADLLSGEMGKNVRIDCQVERAGEAQYVTAHAGVTFAAWIDLVPSWSFDVTARVVAEEAP